MTSAFWNLVKYEFLINWRRRTILFGCLVFTAVIIFVYLISNQPRLHDMDYETQTTFATNFMGLYFQTTQFFLFVMLPMLTVEIFARDRQIGVYELLRTFPVTPLTYILGKLVAVMSVVLLGVVVISAVIGIYWWLQIGAFDLLWFVGNVFLTLGVPALIACGLSALLAISQPTRRRAVFVGLIYLVVTAVLFARSFASDIIFLDYIATSRPLLIRYHILPTLRAFNMAQDTADVTVIHLLLTNVVALLQLILLVFLGNQWLKRQGSHD